LTHSPSRCGGMAKSCISSAIAGRGLRRRWVGKEKQNTVADIPLTGIASLTIVLIESGMLRTLQSDETPALSKHRAWLCLLLASLFLYNPFLAGADSFGGLNLRHPPSNRATIGSSELQQFRVTDGRSTFAVPEAASIELYPPLPDRPLAVREHPAEGILPAQQFVCASLWFRPPPAS
jgi:hypothetical protein